MGRPNEELEKRKEPRIGAGRIMVFAILAFAVAVLYLSIAGEKFRSVARYSEAIDIDPYHVLNVPRDSDSKALRQSYRSLSAKYHPDKVKNCDQACIDNYKRILLAYKILGNKESRDVYDSTNLYVSKRISKFTSGMRMNELHGSKSIFKNIIRSVLGGMKLEAQEHIASTFAFLVVDSNSPKHESLLNLWSDIAGYYYGRITFVRVDVNDPDAVKELPFKNVMTPMIYIMSYNEQPTILQRMEDLTPRGLINFFNNNISNIIEPIDERERFDQVLKEQYNQDLRVNIGLVNIKIPSSSLRAIALDYWSSAQLYDFRGRYETPMGEVPAFVYYANGEYFHIPIPKHVTKIDYLDSRRFASAVTPEELLSSPSGRITAHLRSTLRSIFSKIPVYLAAENAYHFCSESGDSDSVCHASLSGTWKSTGDTGFDIIRVQLRKSDRKLLGQDSELLITIPNRKCSPVDGVVEWKDFNYESSAFSSAKISKYIELARWIRMNPWLFCGLTVGSAALAFGFRWLLASKEAEE